MPRIPLDLQYEFVLRSSLSICLRSTIGGKHHARNRRERIRIPIDHHKRSWRDQWKHRRTVEVGIDPRNNVIIKSANKLRVERCSLTTRCVLDSELDCSDSRLPGIVL